MHDILYTLAYFSIVCAILWILAFFIALCANDARRRGASPVLVVLACILFFPVGVILWLLLRPDPLDKSGPRRFRLEDHRLQ